MHYNYQTIQKEAFPYWLKKGGSDCWSVGYIIRKALEFIPNASQIDVMQQGTGLWAETIVHNGAERKNVRIYG